MLVKLCNILIFNLLIFQQTVSRHSGIQIEILRHFEQR